MGSHAFITNVTSRSVSVIDTETNSVVATVDVDAAPIRMALTPDEKQAYITMRGNTEGQVTVLDTVTHDVTALFSLTDFFIAGVAVTPDGRHAYVGNSGNDDVVKVLDTATNTVAVEILIPTVIDIAISPDGKHTYTTDFNGVTVIDNAHHTVETMIPASSGTTSIEGRGIAVSPDSKTAYLTNGGLDTVSVIDTATNTETGVIAVGSDPLGIAVSPDGSTVYVTNNGAASVSVIDTATNTVSATIAVANRPFGVAFTSDGERAVVANSASNSVSVIDTGTTTVVATVPVGTKPFAVGIVG